MLSVNLPVFVLHRLQKVLTWNDLEQVTQGNKMVSLLHLGPSLHYYMFHYYMGPSLQERY